ncbi:hypothetical protein KIN20_037230 [Parelaphostrongylus tenuis]|uniref:Uncharacterized protein n=1 Tax=Parelaphostrongylus tenuis TaxID=148309 RepID=A0AAD5WLV2_PARTN|nr:hypothetical protein KIN20_037230 [Parelaphostrongylus tenuis]
MIRFENAKAMERMFVGVRAILDLAREWQKDRKAAATICHINNAFDPETANQRLLKWSLKLPIWTVLN